MKDEDCQYIRQYFCYLIIIEPVILSYVQFLNVSLGVKMSKIHEKCSILRLYKQLLPPSSHAIWRSEFEKRSLYFLMSSVFKILCSL